MCFRLVVASDGGEPFGPRGHNTVLMLLLSFRRIPFLNTGHFFFRCFVSIAVSVSFCLCSISTIRAGSLPFSPGF